jgi:hypothetical protein
VIFPDVNVAEVVDVKDAVELPWRTVTDEGTERPVVAERLTRVSEVTVTSS